MHSAASLAGVAIRLAGASVLVGPIAPAAAAGADPTPQIISCSAITDSVKRLACFDDIASGLQAAANDAAESALATQPSADSEADRFNDWSTTVEKSKMTDTTDVYLQLRAKESVRVRYQDLTPVLNLRCMEKKTNAYIDFGGAFMADIQSYGTVTFRIDKKPAFTKEMEESTDHQALGLWNGGSAIPFIKSLFGGTTMVVRALPYGESAVTFEFNIHGTKAAVEPLSKACGWSVEPAKQLPPSTVTLPALH